MGTGLTIIVIGAIFAFAVRADSDVVDLQVVGIILMIAGGVIIWHAKRTTVDESVVTHIERDSNDDSEQPTETTEERTVQRRIHGEHGIRR